MFRTLNASSTFFLNTVNTGVTALLKYALIVRRGKFKDPLNKLPLEIVLYLSFNVSVTDNSS